MGFPRRHAAPAGGGRVRAFTRPRLARVPATVLRDGPFGVGAVQRFVRFDPAEHFFTLEVARADVFRRVALFDLVANNADRKGGHCLLGDDGEVWMIDHGLCFSVEPKLRTVIWTFVDEPFPVEARRTFAGGRGPRHGRAAREHLRDLLEEDEVEATRERTEASLALGRFPEPEPGVGRSRGRRSEICGRRSRRPSAPSRWPSRLPGWWQRTSAGGPVDRLLENLGALAATTAVSERSAATSRPTSPVARADSRRLWICPSPRGSPGLCTSPRSRWRTANSARTAMSRRRQGIRGVPGRGNRAPALPDRALVPCHRIVPAGPGFGTYGGHPERRAFLLRLEGAI